jgi:hypothetical protein
LFTKANQADQTLLQTRCSIQLGFGDCRLADDLGQARSQHVQSVLSAAVRERLMADA